MNGALPAIGPQQANHLNLFGLPKNAVNQLAPGFGGRGSNVGVMVIPSASKPVSYMTQGEYSSHPIFHS